MIKVIKSDTDYHDALLQIEKLLDLDPTIGTQEADALELLTLLVQDYESKKFQFAIPDPIEAIKFRMEQQNLTQRDLIPLIGSRSKVSEVLSGKRPLSLSMIRALHSELGIPAQVLLQDHDPSHIEEVDIDWTHFPLKEMITRKWIDEPVTKLRDQTEDILRRYFSKLGSTSDIMALYRQTNHLRTARSMDIYALYAWTARIIIKAQENPLQVIYKPGTVTLDFMQEVTRLSWSQIGPQLAVEFLRGYGIHLLIEPHLPRTYLDGAVIAIKCEKPIVGLTLRYDRIDNFWFCLMHELAHISLHVNHGISTFYDDLDIGDQNVPQEREADNLAQEALISRKEWDQSNSKTHPTPLAVEELARQLKIHPAIVAGRIRHEFKFYRSLSKLLGHRQVRKLFPDIQWK